MQIDWIDIDERYIGERASGKVSARKTQRIVVIIAKEKFIKRVTNNGQEQASKLRIPERQREWASERERESKRITDRTYESVEADETVNKKQKPSRLRHSKCVYANSFTDDGYRFVLKRRRRNIYLDYIKWR